MAYNSQDLANVSAGDLVQSRQSVYHYYNSAGDSVATIIGAGYVTDAIQRGLKVGDVVWVWNVGGTNSAVEILTVSSLQVAQRPAGTGSATLGKNVSIS